MRETDFIGQNKEKWSEFERVLREGGDDAEKLSRLFIEVTDDLSYSRTFYPNRSVRLYLNGIAQQIYYRIYRHREKSRGAFKRFWVEELPDGLWHARKAMLISFIIFVLGFSIGLLSSANDNGFVNLILGDSYIEMTERNIENGDPMGVYGSHSHFETFLYIAWNNIRVGFMCFLLGALFEIGSMFIVFSNSIMVGAFIWFFVQRDLFRESFLAIMLHGTLELSMIVLAGAAGITLGSGLVFPGSYSRLQAFLMSARRGIRIMLGVSAFLLIAAFIEGFATRYTDAPDIIRLCIIALSLIIVLGYFVWYPYRRYRQGKVQIRSEQEMLAGGDGPLQFNLIKKTGQIINEAWRLYGVFVTRIILIALALSLVFSTLLFTLLLTENHVDFFDPYLFYNLGLIYDLLNGFWFWDEANNFFRFANYPGLFLIMAPLFGLLLAAVLQQYNRSKQVLAQDSNSNPNRFVWANGLTTGCLLLVPFFLSEAIGAFFVTLINLIWWPVWMFQLAVSHEEGEYILDPSLTGFRRLKGRLGNLYGLFISQGFVLWAAMSIVGAPLFYIVFNIVGSNISGDFKGGDALIYFLHSTLMMWGLASLLPVLLYSFLLQTHSNREVNEAINLKQRIAEITFKKQAYGLEKDQ